MIGIGGGPAAALLSLAVLTWVGVALRARSGFLQRSYVPASLVAGGIGLAAGPEVAGRLSGWGGLWSDSTVALWRDLPDLLISVIFAALFLGRLIPGPRRVWRLAGPQVATGQMTAWGHYMVGFAVVLLLLGPLYDLPAAAGTLLEVGYIGGHGTAAGMASAFDEAGYPEGTDLALGLATIGVVVSVAIGVLFVNWAVKTGRAPADLASPEADEREDDPAQRDFSGASLIPAFAAIAAAIGLGWLLLTGLTLVERLVWGDSVELVEHLPLFPFALVGGIALQLVLMAVGRGETLDRRAVGAVGDLSLDLLIVSAIATLSLSAIGEDLVPFLILAGAGIAWSVFALVVLYPRMLPDWWVPRAASEFGQSIGMVAAGLMLIRVADPKGASPVPEAFGYKQILFEPVLGGGLATAASVIVVAAIGGWPVFLATAALWALWLVVGLRLFGPATGRRD